MKSIFTTLLALLLTYYGSAQSAKEVSSNPYKGMPLKERLFFGGDFGLSFGDITYVRVAPIIGYHVSPKIGFGGGPSYQYWRFNYIGINGPTSSETQIIGLNTFVRWFPFESIFAQTDFELLNLKSSFRDPSASFFDEQVTRVNVPVWLVGAGYVQRSGRAGFMLGVFYDLIQDRNSPYGRDLIIRAGMFF
jgi:hypothetical protein